MANMRWDGSTFWVHIDGKWHDVGSDLLDLTNAYQPLDGDLTAIAALAPTDGNVIVGNGTTWVAESGATARTSLGLGSAATQTFASGAHTGTATGVANIDSVTALAGLYVRIGNVVHVSGAVTVDPASIGASTQFRMTLPVASNFTSVRDLSGTCSTAGIAGAGGIAVADTSNDEALFSLVSEHTSSQNYNYSYSYLVL